MILYQGNVLNIEQLEDRSVPTGLVTTLPLVIDTPSVAIDPPDAEAHVPVDDIYNDDASIIGDVVGDEGLEFVDPGVDNGDVVPEVGYVPGVGADDGGGLTSLPISPFPVDWSDIFPDKLQLGDGADVGGDIAYKLEEGDGSEIGADGTTDGDGATGNEEVFLDTFDGVAFTMLGAGGNVTVSADSSNFTDTLAMLTSFPRDSFGLSDDTLFAVAASIWLGTATDFFRFDNVDFGVFDNGNGGFHIWGDILQHDDDDWRWSGG